jgi:hypothetical protein
MYRWAAKNKPFGTSMPRWIAPRAGQYPYPPLPEPVDWPGAGAAAPEAVTSCHSPPEAFSSWGSATTLSIDGSVGPAHSLSLAVSSGGSAIITFNGGLNNLWAVSCTVTGGFSAQVMLASGAGSNKYNPIGTSHVALNNAGQASVVWSVLDGHTGVLTRSASGAWSTETVLTARTAPSIPVSTAIDGAGNAIAVFGSSCSWHLAGGSWQTAAALPSGSSGGLAGDAVSAEAVS